MARKKPDVPVIYQPDDAPEPPAHGDIIPDGDFAGLPTDQVVRALTDGIHNVFEDANVDLPTAGCALDMALGEYLHMVEVSIGPHNAKIAALAFCETALPYAVLEVPIAATYVEARQINAAMKKGGMK